MRIKQTLKIRRTCINGLEAIFLRKGWRMTHGIETTPGSGKPLKGKSVRRTIDVLEYMAAKNAGVTVMDVARALSIPQSTTSELLVALVDMGIAARDISSKYYSATPRLAAIGLAAQPPLLAEGSVFRAIDDFAARTGLIVGLFGINDTKVQPCWMSGMAVTGRRGAVISSGLDPQDLFRDASVHLAAGSIGLMLLSSLGEERSSRLLWRIRAETSGQEKSSHSELCHSVRLIREKGSASGLSGFSKELAATAVMLPSHYGEQPLALAALYPRASFIDTHALARALIQNLTPMRGMPDDEPAVENFDIRIKSMTNLSLVRSC
jgi:DNA-binding IclR family transcriptional regulator